MTINQIISSIVGKYACSAGVGFSDSTPFQGANPDDFCELLAKEGFESKGWEMMYSGTTGMPIKAQVFMGVTYYQRLKHMVQDKNHSRRQGKVQTLTKQPTEGKSKGGGLRFGEMERDALISHSASAFLREKLFLLSDKYSVPVCVNCGLIGHPGKTRCRSCPNDKLVEVSLPYASKLLCQELLSMNIALRIRVKNGIADIDAF
jgi:DNA-directed RNA polymerase beta subunit